ncbi:unnamed protein product, partial [Didymodactylos carnosus]
GKPRTGSLEELIKPVVPHTIKQVVDICKGHIHILFKERKDFPNKNPLLHSQLDREFFQISEEADENEKRSQYAYRLMLYDLCHAMLNDIYTSYIQQSQYP